MKDNIVPIGAHLENDYPSSIEVIDLLEKAFKTGTEKGEYKIAGLAIDVTRKKNNETYDAVEMRFYEFGKDVCKKYFRYRIKEHSVEFFDD
jgi:hypothetical protein